MKALPPQKQAALVHAAMRIWPRSFTGYPSALTDAQVFARTEVKAQSIREVPLTTRTQTASILI
jgi:hypothetical protein